MIMCVVCLVTFLVLAILMQGADVGKHDNNQSKENDYEDAGDDADANIDARLAARDVEAGPYTRETNCNAIHQPPVTTPEPKSASTPLERPSSGSGPRALALI